MRDEDRAMHLTGQDLTALLDPGLERGERSATDRAARAAAHVVSCEECAAAVRAARDDERVVADALRALDHPMPSMDVAAMIVSERTMATGQSSVRPAMRVLRRGPIARRATMLARSGALIALGAAAAAAAVAPRSPLRRVVARLFTTHSAPALVAHPASPAPVAALSVLPAAERGVAIVPGGHMDVVFRGAAAGAVVRITRTDSATLAVRSDAAGPAFAVARDSVLVDADRARAAHYDVVVPRSAALVRVRVGERVVFTQRESRVTAVVAPDAGEAYTIPLK